MERWRRAVYTIVQLSFLVVLTCLLPMQVSGETVEEEVKIDKFPVEEVFRVENTKPGDSAYRTLAIQNNHDRDILYTMIMKNTGEPKLFNELKLEVVHAGEVVFNGKLKDYNGVADRPLTAQTEEIIEFTLKFPEELGNEFQGLRAEFLLNITARAVSEGNAIDDLVTGGGKKVIGTPGSGNGTGSLLPETATNIFTFLVIGCILLTIGGVTSYWNHRKRQFQE